MDIQRTLDDVRITLSREETNLLRRALERATFIDTPAAEQPAILTFCSQVLDALGAD